MIAEISRQYLAGLIDGEGCLRIQKAARPHGHIYTCSVSIRMRQDASALLQTISEKEGIGVYFYEGQTCKGNINWRPTCLIEWRGPSAARICRELFPFLILKRDQAKVLLDFEKFRLDSHKSKINRGKGNGAGGRRLPASYYRQAERLYLKCRELKRYKQSESSIL